MRVALAFWGITRSLQRTIKSIQANVFDVLRKNNIEYTIFMHTFFVPHPFTNPRSKEYNMILPPKEYKLLKPDYVLVENQDKVKQKLDLTKYRTHKDPWNTDYASVDNYICAMYSKQQVGRLIEKTGSAYDYVIFLRPDVRYITPFNLGWFQFVSPTCVAVPNFHVFSNINDRFMIATYENAIKTADLFRDLYAYSLQQPLHSETLLHLYVTRILNLEIKYISFLFNRIRSNGLESRDGGSPLTHVLTPVTIGASPGTPYDRISFHTTPTTARSPTTPPDTTTPSPEKTHHMRRPFDIHLPIQLNQPFTPSPSIQVNP
jgi:hypothetical protein